MLILLIALYLLAGFILLNQYEPKPRSDNPAYAFFWRVIMISYWPIFLIILLHKIYREKKDIKNDSYAGEITAKRLLVLLGRIGVPEYRWHGLKTDFNYHSRTDLQWLWFNLENYSEHPDFEEAIKIVYELRKLDSP